MASGLDACFTLRNGVRMPYVGLGTYKMKQADIEVALPAALATGYRLIDTATIYRNEEFVGSSLRSAMTRLNLTRSDIFITSKLQTADQGYEQAKAAIDTSLHKLGLDYIDCYLIHWPGASGLPPDSPEHAAFRAGSWRALEEALAEGKLRSIGVSNYLERHLREMESYAQVMPMINQIELHPQWIDHTTISYCQQQGIMIQAYSSLGKGMLLQDAFLTEFPIITQIAQSHGGKSISQILLKWALQHGYGIIPKSVSPERIQENADLFTWGDLSAEEMAALDAIHRLRPVKYCWDPNVVA